MCVPRLWLIVSLILWRMLPAVASPDSLPFHATARWPVITVPRGAVPPMEGSADPKGYHVAGLPSFVTLEAGNNNGWAAAEDTLVCLGYTEAALYVGFRMDMPEDVAPKITATQGRDTAFEDDAFEIFLVTGDRDGEQFEIAGTAGGVTWERRFDQPGDWTAWNPNIKYLVHTNQFDSRRGAHFWEGEFSIPWTELGVPAFKEGDVWRANFVANRRSPKPRMDAWSYWKEWRDQSGYGRLVFGGERLYFHVGYGWKLAAPDNSTPFSLRLDIRNPKPEFPRRVEWDWKIYRREPTAGGLSFHRELAALRQQATGEGATFATLEEDVKRVLTGYQFVKGWGQPRTFPVPQPSGPVVTNLRVDREGDYLLTYYVRDVTSTNQPLVIAGGVLPMRFGASLNVTLWPYLLTRQSIVLQAGLQALADKRKEIADLRAWVCRPGDARVLAEANAKYVGQAQEYLEVSVAKLPVGQYEARLRLLDEAGKTIRESSALPFSRPEEPDWWVKRGQYGAEPEVPEPWTPVKWKEGRVEVWGREYQFGKSPVPEKIVNQGQEILAGPIRLDLQAAGQTQPWQKRSAKVFERRPGHVLLETSQEAAGVRIKSRTRVEFDGFSLVDLLIEPTAEKAQIDGLDLVLPVKAEYAEFLTCYKPVPGPGLAQDLSVREPVVRFTGGTAAARHMIGRYVGRTPDHFESVVMLTIWLGRDDFGGLEWSAESSKGWSLAHPLKAIEVDHRGKIVEARFHFIDHPISLRRVDGPRHIRFGLIATPTKPVPPERRRLRVDSTGIHPAVSGHPYYIGVKGSNVGCWGDASVTEQHNIELWRDWFRAADILASTGGGGWGVGAYWAWNPPITDSKLKEFRRAQVGIAREHGKIDLWFGGWGVPPTWEHWDTWGKEMLKWPLEPTFAQQYKPSYASPFLEYMIYCFAHHAREIGIQGIRFDTVIPWWSKNPFLGETWLADDGQTYGSYNLFRQREFLKRAYRIFHGGVVKDGLLYLPLGGPPIMTVESFSDIREIGEGFYQNAPTLREAYPPDLVRVWMTKRAYGFAAALSNLKGAPLGRRQRIGALLVHGAEPRLSGRPNFYGPDPIREGRALRPAEQLWSAWSWIDRATAQWWPHWKNREMVATAGDGEHYVSFHLQPGRRMLLVATNYEQRPQELTITLNLKALGFGGHPQLEAQDALTEEAVPFESNTLRLTLEPEMFRLLKVAPRAELAGPYLDPEPRHQRASQKEAT